MIVISQSTFYQWLKKLRDQACYKIPETESENSEISSIQKQDVVKLNMYPENLKYEKLTLNAACSISMNDSELELLSPWNESVKASCSIEVK